MPAPYSEDLRWKAIQAYENKEGNQREIAERFKLSLRSFERYLRRYKETGGVSPILDQGGRRSTIDEKGLDEIKKIIKLKPDMTLQELCEHHTKKSKKKVGISVMHRTVKKLGFRRKKKSHYALEQERPDIKKTKSSIRKKDEKRRHKSVNIYR